MVGVLGPLSPGRKKFGGHRWPPFSLVFGVAENYATVQRQAVENNVEALAILIGPRSSDTVPVGFIAFADHGVCNVGRAFGFGIGHFEVSFFKTDIIVGLVGDP